MLCFGTMILGWFISSELWFKRTVKNIRIYTSGINLHYDESIGSRFIRYSAFEKVLKGVDMNGEYYILKPKRPSKIRVRIWCSTPGAMKYLPTIKAQIEKNKK